VKFLHPSKLSWIHKKARGNSSSFFEQSISERRIVSVESERSGDGTADNRKKRAKKEGDIYENKFLNRDIKQN
jgi:hypothetical protein